MQTSDTLVRPSPALPAARPRTSFGAALTGAILIALGGLWTLDIAGAIELRWQIVLPALLTVIGVALIAGAWTGPHAGPVVLGVFVSIAVVALATVPFTSFSGVVGNREFRVTQQTSLAANYEVGVGDLTLDLSNMQMVESATVQVSVGAGKMTVVLPSSVPVDVNATVGAGEMNLLGARSDGLAVNRHFQSERFEAADITLTLDLNVGAGNIEVVR